MSRLAGAMGISLLAHLVLLTGFLWLAGGRAAPPPTLQAAVVKVNLLPGPPPGRGQNTAPGALSPPAGGLAGVGGGEGQGGGRHGGGPDVAPRALARPRPAYPALARRQGVEGEVLARVLVGRQGKVAVVKILAAEPSGYFEEAIQEAVSAWGFRPAEKDGRAVDAWMETTVRFRLEG